MNKNTETPLTDLRLISPLKIPETGFFRSKRLFTCPPGYYYCVFKKTSAGPEFVQSYGPNQKGTLEKDQEIYRVSIAGTPLRYEFQETFTMLDDEEIGANFELNIKISDGVKIARSVVQNRVDPLIYLKKDIKNIIDEEISQMDYRKTFSAKSRETKLDPRKFEEKVKQHTVPEDYGISLDAIRIKFVLSQGLKQKWESDITSWKEAEINQENIDKRKRELDLKEEIAQLSVKESKLSVELDRDLEKIKYEQEDFKSQRGIDKEDQSIERERKLRKDEESERQSAIREETEHLIDIRQIEQQAIFDQQTAEQRQQIRLDAEQRIHDRKETIKSLQHQVTTNQMMEQLDYSRRKQEELEKIHELRMQRLEEWEKIQIQGLQANQNLEIERLQDEQRLLLEDKQNKAELEHKNKLLEYQKDEDEHKISVDRAKLENQEIHEDRIARIKLRDKLVEARLAMLDRISTGESKLTPKQIKTLFGIDPMNEKVVVHEQVAGIVDALDEYLSSDSGAEKIQNILSQLKRPALTTIDAETSSDEQTSNSQQMNNENEDETDDATDEN